MSSIGKLTVVYGLPGSGKSYYVRNSSTNSSVYTVRLTQGQGTEKLSNCISLVEQYIKGGMNVLLESYNWHYPTTRPYQVIEEYFEQNTKQCIRNIINDAIRQEHWYSGIRMDALIENKDSYNPKGLLLKVYRSNFRTSMINEYFKRFPTRYEQEIRSILR